jgi:NADPH:quinone reductase-like Zn-dependent oxidoreductase
MRAMVLEKTGRAEDSPLALREVATPQPGPAEVRATHNM